jgi:hypothetical protein
VTRQIPRHLAALEEHVSQGQQPADNRARFDKFKIDGHYYEHFVLVVDKRSLTQ